MYILMAEGKGILPSARDSLYKHYSVTRMIRLIREEKEEGGCKQTGVWKHLCDTFAVLREPKELAALIPVHELELFCMRDTWEVHAVPFFSTSDSNTAIKEFLGLLGWGKKGRIKGLIDFSTFSPRDIGDLYEVILAATDRAQKEECAFYTPHWAVSHMVKAALDPLVKKFLKDGADRLFDLAFLDPAMGSGHFLVEIVTQLASTVMVEYGMQDEGEDNREGEEELHSSDDDTTASMEQSVLTRIATQCIYGVDKNPIAADLAKCALVLICGRNAVSSGQLDEHLVCGDSIMGCASHKDMSDLELPLEGFKSVRHYLKNQKLTPSQKMLLAKSRVLTPPSLSKEVAQAIQDRLLKRSDRDLSFAKQWLKVASKESSDYIDASVHWPVQFPHLISESDTWAPPVFDAVVTNPPWLAISGGKMKKSTELEGYLRTVNERLTKNGLYRFLPEGQPNLYHFFLERCVSLLNPEHGQLGFLVQASVLTAKWKEPGRTGKSYPYFTKVLDQCAVTSLLEFPKKTLFEKVNVPCVIFAASKGPADLSFPYKRFTKAETSKLKRDIDEDSDEHPMKSILRAQMYHTTQGLQMIKHALYPRSTPPIMLDLLHVYLVPDPSHRQWKKYGDYCRVIQGNVSESSVVPGDDSRTGKTPFIKNTKVQHFAHVGVEDADFWAPSSSVSSDYPIRVATKKVMDSTNARRLRGAVLIDTEDGQHLWAADSVVTHDFTGKPSFGTPEMSVYDRAYIFCCLMNSDLLECIVRLFDETNNISSGKITRLPLPDLSSAIVPTGWTPKWNVLKKLNERCPVNEVLNLLNAPLTSSSTKGGKMGCVLRCLATIGEHMRELTTTDGGVVTLETLFCKRVLRLMNKFVNSLYNLTVDDTDYIDAVYRDILHVYDKRQS